MDRNNRNISCRPREHLIAMGKRYPQAWKQVDEFRDGKGKDLPDWPDWCFLPLAAAYSIISAKSGMYQLTPRLAEDIGKLGALCIWRVTQGVYRFDPTVYDYIRKTPLTKDLPSDVFYRLPEWCIYIETPDMTYPELGRIYGSFVHLEWDANSGRSELRLLIDSEKELMPIPLHIGSWSLVEAIERMKSEADKQSKLLSGSHLKNRLGEVDWIQELVSPILSLTLYLCSEDADMGESRPGRPGPKKTKNGMRWFAPDKPRVWELAVRLGSAIRNAYQAEQTGQEKPHEGPRPHIRRAHWHSFWVGPKDDPEHRKLIVKWIPPIAVNVDSVDQLATTVRRVD